MPDRPDRKETLTRAERTDEPGRERAAGRTGDDQAQDLGRRDLHAANEERFSGEQARSGYDLGPRSFAGENYAPVDPETPPGEHRPEGEPRTSDADEARRAEERG